MLVEKLMGVYGLPTKEAEEFLKAKASRMNEAEQEAMAGRIIEERPSRFGFPDVAALAKFFKANAEPARPLKYYWCVCNDCGCEYSYGFFTCPDCFLANKKSSGYKVKTSDGPPKNHVVRWNMETFRAIQGEKICAKCALRGSFCRMFGNPDASCSREDFDTCACRECCADHKRFNKKYAGGAA